ncbi:MAG: hypothetical protein ABSH51_00055 [Solirubrobacteraceae bacterium]
MPVLRLAIVVWALLACAWFALGAVQTHDENAAIALIDQPGTPSATQTARILALLHGAARLNPDRNIALYRSQAQTRAGDSAAAVRTALSVTRAEPLNIDAWTVLAFAAQRTDPAQSRRAQREQLTLAPPVPAAP